MNKFSENDVLKSLGNVLDPEIKRDLVSLNMIKNVVVDSNNVSFDLELTTPACPLKNMIKLDCENQLKDSFPKIGKITINFTARVKAHKNEIKDKILPGVKNTVAVASGKGGVGKSTVAVNLALSLSAMGAKVGIIDADIYGPSIPLMLGVNKRMFITDDPSKVKITPVENFGLKIMSIGFLIDDDSPVIWRGPMASSAVKQFMNDVEWGELDYLIFDLPPGTGDIQLTLAQTIPLTGAVIVTTPQDVALMDAKKGLKMFEKVNVPVLGIIENMSYFIAPDTKKRYDIFGHGGGKRLAEQLNTKFLGEIPIEPQIREGGDAGTPIVTIDGHEEYKNIFKEISQKLAAEISVNNFSTNEIEINL